MLKNLINMKKALFILLFLSLQWAYGQSEKQRLIILADMGNEPDEVQQMVHMVILLWM